MGYMFLFVQASESQFSLLFFFNKNHSFHFTESLWLISVEAQIKFCKTLKETGPDLESENHSPFPSWCAYAEVGLQIERPKMVTGGRDYLYFLHIIRFKLRYCTRFVYTGVWDLEALWCLNEYIVISCGTLWLVSSAWWSSIA